MSEAIHFHSADGKSIEDSQSEVEALKWLQTSLRYPGGIPGAVLKDEKLPERPQALAFRQPLGELHDLEAERLSRRPAIAAGQLGVGAHVELPAAISAIK